MKPGSRFQTETMFNLNSRSGGHRHRRRLLRRRLSAVEYNSDDETQVRTIGVNRTQNRFPFQNARIVFTENSSKNARTKLQTLASPTTVWDASGYTIGRRTNNGQHEYISTYERDEVR